MSYQLITHASNDHIIHIDVNFQFRLIRCYIFLKIYFVHLITSPYYIDQLISLIHQILHFILPIFSQINLNHTHYFPILHSIQHFSTP